jgi:hemoglobin-like flavoprotein
MEASQKKLVQESWAQVETISDTAATLFYDRLFTLDPSLRAMFPSELGEQKKKLMQTLAVAVRGLDDTAQLVPALESLGRRHAEYDVKESHYATVGDAFLWTLEQGLGDAYTADVRQAWVDTYTLVASVMKRAAAEATADAGV